MSFIIPFFELLVIIIVVAMRGREGIWGNFIALVNVITASLVAVNFWEPIAKSLAESQPSYFYLYDILLIWGLFAITLLVFSLLTDWVSRVKVRFPKHFDLAGSFFLAIWLGWYMLCFTAFSLHAAPMSRDFVAGKSGGNTPGHIAILEPELRFLSFAQKMSLGAFSRLVDSSEPDRHVFDPSSVYRNKYYVRRGALESSQGLLYK